MNPVEALPRMVDKLHIDENTEGNVSGGEKSIEHVHDLNNITIPSYDIDRMTAEELQASLREIAEDARQPFSFLADISKEFTCDNYRLSMRTKTSTDIDIQLAAVAKRIESCKMLLEKGKSSVGDTHCRANPSSIDPSSNT